MYNVPKHNPEVYLIHRDGRRWVFDDIEEAAEELYRLRYITSWYNRKSQIGEHFSSVRERDWDSETNEYTYYYYDYIVRDDTGVIITDEDLIVYRDRIQQRIRDNADKRTVSEFRRGPVPHTSSKRAYYSGYRHINTIQEIRENEFLKYDEDALEYNIKPRPERNNLPTAWDDISRDDWNAKNWKKHRKHQWREK